jgi:hypothetical protein
MDIIVKIKPLKATYETLSLFYKLIIALLLISLLSIIIPHESYAAENDMVNFNTLTFEAGDYLAFIDDIQTEAEKKYNHEVAVAKLQRQLKMNTALKNYLVSKNSPLAEFSATLLQQNNWKKILALANAESTMCRRYIESLSNCWGVGGSDLWDMGDNLSEGVVAMNKFLNTAPSKSKVKYSQMNFEQMNGLYKQPPGDHWVYNNLEIYNELIALEKSVK